MGATRRLHRSIDHSRRPRSRAHIRSQYREQRRCALLRLRVLRPGTPPRHPVFQTCSSKICEAFAELWGWWTRTEKVQRGSTQDRTSASASRVGRPRSRPRRTACSLAMVVENITRPTVGRATPVQALRRFEPHHQQAFRFRTRLLLRFRQNFEAFALWKLCQPSALPVAHFPQRAQQKSTRSSLCRARSGEPPPLRRQPTRPLASAVERWHCWKYQRGSKVLILDPFNAFP
jgi:hypothetical protein